MNAPGSSIEQRTEGTVPDEHIADHAYDFAKAEGDPGKRAHLEAMLQELSEEHRYQFGVLVLSGVRFTMSDITQAGNRWIGVHGPDGKHWGGMGGRYLYHIIPRVWGCRNWVELQLRLHGHS